MAVGNSNDAADVESGGVRPLRRPCTCGGETGELRPRGGQDCLFCVACGRFQYNAPRIETGRKARTVQTLHALAPSQRHRVLQRDGHRCVLCGATAEAGALLHVGHILSVKDGLAAGFTEADLSRDLNLMTECEACNLGHGGFSLPLPMLIRLYRVFLLAEDRRSCAPR